MKKRLQGEEKFPLVLMLEPTHQCNLSCTGCGRIQEYRETLGQSLTLEECLRPWRNAAPRWSPSPAANPCSIPRSLSCCTNWCTAQTHLSLHQRHLAGTLPPPPTPSDRLTLSIHMDGLHLVMLRAAQRQHVPPHRMSFIDTVRWLLGAEPGEPLADLLVNPYRPNRHEPRRIKDLQDSYTKMVHPRKKLRKALKKQAKTA